MQKNWRTMTLLLSLSMNLVVFPGSSLAQQIKQQQPANQIKQTTNLDKPRALASLSVSGPFKSGNLAVYLIHGKDAVPNQKMITLSEALAQKKVVVHETGSVNQLAVQNVGETAVFIQSGDIVKGGQQDRTLQNDLILPPKSGRIPVDSFCVEHGRWQQRGSEAMTSFSSSPSMLASKGLKLAAKGSADQGMVWKEVENYQGKMMTKAQFHKAPSVISSPSPSSLQLTLESDGVKKLSHNYLRDLKPVVAGKNDAIGYAFAVNGKINSVDVYSSHDLFQRLWPKLVASSAQEAAAESEDGKTFTPPAPEKVKQYIAETETSGKESKQTVGGRMVVVRRESSKNLFTETQDRLAGKQLWYHKNYLTK